MSYGGMDSDGIRLPLRQEKLRERRKASFGIANWKIFLRMYGQEPHQKLSLDMARARNIKPSLFKNEVLGVEDPLFTLLFEGLWLLADREGRLEDRPLRIKAEIFPYRDGVDIEGMLKWLEANEFIVRYESCNKKCIQVCNFKKHQNPHKNEPESELPAIDVPRTDSDELGKTSEKIGSDTEKIGSTRADSLNLIPETSTPSLRSGGAEGADASHVLGGLSSTANQAAFSLSDDIFSRAIPFLIERGMADREARSLIGRLRKGINDDLEVSFVVDALLAEKPAEPQEWITGAIRSRKQPGVTLSEFLAGCRAKDEAAIPEDDPVFGYAEDAGIPSEFLRIAWQEFRANYANAGKRNPDWRDAFRRFVRANWLGLWFYKEGRYELTSKGYQAMAVMSAKDKRAEATA